MMEPQFILLLSFVLQVACNRTNDTIIEKIFEIGNIYSYNKSFSIDKLNSADIPIPSDCPTYEESGGFYFDNILGYIIEDNQETCVKKCCGYQNCVAVNYVNTINWCVLLASYMPENNFLWSEVDSKHFFFPSKENKDYSNSQKGIVPTMLGQAYFTPIDYLHQSTRRRRVVDGQVSKPFSLPWSVFIQTAFFDKNHVKRFMRCTGFLVANNPSSTYVGESSSNIITAAHCFSVGLIENITVILGTHRRDVIEEHEVQLGVKSVIGHPRYQGFGLQANDIALLVLEKPVYFSEYIRPVALPSTTLSVTLNETIWLSAGWGDTSEYGYGESMVLQQTTVKLQHCTGRIITTSVTCLTITLLVAGDSGCALLGYDPRTSQFTAYAVLSGNLQGNSFYTNIDGKNGKWIERAFACEDPTRSHLGYEIKNGCFYPCNIYGKIFQLPHTLAKGSRITITGNVTTVTRDFVIKFLTDSEQNEHFLKIQLKFSDSPDSYGQMSRGGRNWITNPQKFAYGTGRFINVVLERTTDYEYKVSGQNSNGSPLIQQQTSAKDFKFFTVLYNGNSGTIHKVCFETKNKWGWLPWTKKWLSS